MPQHAMSTGAGKSVSTFAWAERWLVPYWGLGAVALFALLAFLVVILWFAL